MSGPMKILVIGPGCTKCKTLAQFTDQAVQELAFKWQGFSFQQEFHWKQVNDRSVSNGSAAHKTNLYGGYAQVGYFFNEIIDCFPEELELAFRYAHVREPAPGDRQEENDCQD